MHQENPVLVSTAFWATSEVVRILQEAIHNDCKISVDIQAGIKEGAADGSYKIQIEVEDDEEGTEEN